jgi:rubredoxin-NAD+ reductase
MTDARLARNSGLAFDKGIKVDSKTLQTSEVDIYALGDCISIDGEPCRFIEPIARQAKALVHALLGKVDKGYCHSQPVVRLKTRSLPIELHGMPVTEGIWITVSQGNGYLRMEQWFEDNQVSTLLVGKNKAS